MGWRPIETAPKDGTIIDLLFRGNTRVTDCAWSNGEWWTSEQGEPVVCVSHGPAQPTHWMPLPTPPGSTTAADPGEDLYQAERAFVAALNAEESK
jgi:hypothetical protein